MCSQIRPRSIVMILLLLVLVPVWGASCLTSADDLNRKTVDLGAQSFSVGDTSGWFDLTEWTQPDRTTVFTVDVTTTKALDFVNEANPDGSYEPEEKDDVRIWAMLQNGHGGPTSYLPMRLRFVSHRKYQATYTGLAPDLATGQKSPAQWKVRVDKRSYGNANDDFTLDVTCTVSYVPWESP